MGFLAFCPIAVTKKTTMVTIARICLQSLLKLVNSVLGMVGIAMVLYGLWMVRVWLRDMDSSSVDQYDAAAAAAPW